MKNKSDKIFGITLTILTIVILALFFVFKDELKRDTNSSSLLDNTTYSVDISDQPTIGNENAPITLVEFGDYKCPACGYFSSSIFPRLYENYIETGKVKLTFKHFPFIFQDSTRTAIFAEGIFSELGNEAFWQFTKAIYDSHTEIYPQNDLTNEGKDIFTKEYLVHMATELFPDTEPSVFDSFFTNEAYKNEVEKDLKEANQTKVSGTPTLVLNGQKLYNSLDYNSIKIAIEESLNNQAENDEQK